jgi:hypothetical protein
MKQQYITLSSFRSDLLEKLMEFSEMIDEQPDKDRTIRTQEDWWKEFKQYMEDV